MSFSLSDRQGVAVISIRGPLHENFQAVVEKAAATSRHVLLDLTESSGLVATDGPLLLKAHQIVLAKAGVFGISDPTPRTQLLLDLLGASKLVPVAPGVEAGVDLVKQRSVGRKQAPTGSMPAMEGGAEAPEKQVETFVRLAIRSQDHVRVLEHVIASGSPLVASKTAAKALGCPPATIDRVLSDLEAVKLVKAIGGGKYQLDPGPTGRALVGALLKMWKQPPQRKLIATWTAECRKERPAGTGTEKIERKGLFGRLRGDG